jgi:hypothetical protein
MVHRWVSRVLEKLDPIPQWSAVGLPLKIWKVVLLMAADVKVRSEKVAVWR